MKKQNVKMLKLKARETKEKNPKITIALLIHGEPHRISDTIDSIKNQTYDNRKITIMCLDDGTSPKAKEIIKKKGLKIYELPKKCNISFAKNFALKNSRDELIFFLDDHIILGKNSVKESIRIIKKYPDIAGVCGRYRSATFGDYNLLRDIKRETIYQKNDFERFITLENFTTFSTGIAVVRKSAFLNYDFPEDIFPNDFGGEDVPALIVALNEGKRFVYTPKVAGVHEHNLTFKDFIKKMEIEIRGRFSLLYWAANNPKFRIPYLHGFLNFPYFLTISIIFALIFLFISPYFTLLPFPFLLYELILSLKCLTSSKEIPLKYRIKASIFVLSSDLLSLVCAVQYLISSYKRPYKKLGFKRFLIINKIFLRWELEKYNILRWRKN